MDQQHILEAFEELVKIKKIDRDFIKEILQQSFQAAVKKKLGEDADIEVKIEYNTGNIAILLKKKIVKRVRNKVTEIDLKAAQEVDEEAEAGDIFYEELPFEEFSWGAVQRAKQLTISEMRKLERDLIDQEYEKKIGEIVTGKIRQVVTRKDRSRHIHRDLIMDLGKTDAVVPDKEVIPGESFRAGDRIKAYIYAVDKTAKEPHIKLSRTHPGFLQKLFELEVPEIYDDIVKIENVVREPGVRAKIAVYSTNPQVDALGACIGIKGSRVQSISDEINGERIDIVVWDEAPEKFIYRALSPAHILNINLDDEKKEAIVVVPDDDRAVAIGKRGVNVKLASKLTGWKLEVIGETDASSIGSR